MKQTNLERAKLQKKNKNTIKRTENTKNGNKVRENRREIRDYAIKSVTLRIKRKDMRRIRLLKSISAMVMALIIASCSSEDGKEPTEATEIYKGEYMELENPGNWIEDTEDSSYLIFLTLRTR